MKKKHQLVVFENGSASLANPETGEAMHSSIGAWEEANALYINQSQLASRLSRPNSSPLVIYDLGLGIAANALAALHCQKVGTTLQIISFENDLGGITTALSYPERFPLLAPFREIVEELLKNRKVIRPCFSWELREGDFLKQDLSLDSPEIVFFDFYSPKSASTLWSLEVFNRLRVLMEKKSALDPLIITYSAATPVRTAMLLAGFYVGVGKATSIKSETTIASLKKSDLETPLPHVWLEKLSRSDRFSPFGNESATREQILEQIKAHPQFADLIGH